jgi:methionine-gamma-lyase
MSTHNIRTLSVHAGSDRSKHHGAVSPPIYTSSIYSFDDAETAEAIHNEQVDGYYYGRLGNPTQDAMEAAVAAVENGEKALAFASGMASISGVILTFVPPGGHIVAPRSLYSTTRKLLKHLETDLNIKTTFIDASIAENYRDATTPETKLHWIETPSNPLLTITDIAAVAAIARSRDIMCVADNTFASPALQQPLMLGADIVVHSATKYLGGHSDLTAGVAAGSQELIQRLRERAGKLYGGNIAPQVAWLVHRGIKTLALRMERHCDNAYAVADMLLRHQKIMRVYYPGSPEDPCHDLAAKQMTGGFGGMVSFDLGSKTAAAAFVSAVQLCTLATSLGGVETIIQHSIAMTNAGMSPDEQEQTAIPPGLVRMSVGIEHIDDIIADIEQALSHV